MRKLVGKVMVMALIMTTLVGCGKSEMISVVSREEGSGTRGAFIELFGVEEKDASGNKTDKTTTEAVQIQSTSVMLTTVAGDKNAIGYVSLGSMNDTVKALKIDGAEASVDNIKSGSYKISRPFLIATKATQSDITKDFIQFILSDKGQSVVAKAGYIQNDNPGTFTSKRPSGKVIVAGSSSVTPVMEKLKEAYLVENPSAQIEVQQSDSSTGMSAAIDGTCDIGMSSRELKDSELSGGITPTTIATDGIAVIVNKDNEVDGLKADQVKAIYTGEVAEWSELN